METSTLFRSWLRERFEAIDQTVDEIADKSGIHRNTIYHLLSDKAGRGERIMLDTARTLCEHLGTSLANFERYVKGRS